MKDVIFKMFNIDAASEVKTVARYDFVKNDAKCKVSKTDTGFLKGKVPVAKVGIMNYLLADGTVLRELVPAETLFNVDSMETLKLKPVTDNHPPERMVDAENASYRQVGTTGETVEQDGEVLVSSLVVTDAVAVDSVFGGRQQLSPGYQAELVYQDGEYNGQRYDAIQVSRKYNHLALVDAARGGDTIKMCLDGADIIIDGRETVKDKSENSNIGGKMVKVKIDSIEYDAAPEVANALTKSDSKVSEVVKENETLQGKCDALQAKVDELEKRDIAKEVNDAVQARLELERIASVVLDSVDQNLDNKALKVAIISKKLPAVKLDGKSEEYVQAILDSVVLTLSKEENDGLAAQRKLTSTKVDGSENCDAAETSRKNMLKRLEEGYQK